jgi:hypothetical protein
MSLLLSLPSSADQCIPRQEGEPLQVFPAPPVSKFDCHASIDVKCETLADSLRDYSEKLGAYSQANTSYLSDISQWAACSYEDLKKVEGADAHEVFPKDFFRTLADGSLAMNDVNGDRRCAQDYLSTYLTKLTETITNPNCMKSPLKTPKGKNSGLRRN